MDKINLKKALMRGTKTNILIFFYCCAISSCTTVEPKFNKVQKKIEPIKFSTNNDGYYTLKLENFQGNIYGRVLDLEQHKPLEKATVSMGCYKAFTDSDGRFKFSIEPKKNFLLYLNCNSIGFIPIETKIIEFSKNSIEINFYLQEDKRPIINCEGFFVK